MERLGRVGEAHPARASEPFEGVVAARQTLEGVVAGGGRGGALSIDRLDLGERLVSDEVGSVSPPAKLGGVVLVRVVRHAVASWASWVGTASISARIRFSAGFARGWPYVLSTSFPPSWWPSCSATSDAEAPSSRSQVAQK